eukprot:PLAT2605.2.p1 GENE.PLAT2605.2~~PLAT2605.2.p1  ORF type:complete len:274 (-),score=93.47 PLAT2605.2:196-1017(-)
MSTPHLPLYSASSGAGGRDHGSSRRHGVHSGRGRSTMSGSGFVVEYFRRMVQLPAMDWEYTYTQMVYLCVNPGMVYQLTSYRKQTRNHFSRDDPAFLVLLHGFLAVAACAYGVACGAGSFVAYLKLILYAWWQLDGLGIAAATLSWLISNRYMLEKNMEHSVAQEVEWLYAFDVHCNSFFPLFLILYVVHYFLLPLVLAPSFLPRLLSNSLFAVGLSAYCYLTFLGYQRLAFIDDERATAFLYPVAAVMLAFFVALLFNFSASRFVLGYYFPS